MHDYPRVKLLHQPLVNVGIRMLFRHGYNDTTNAFKAYRREVIENVQPLLSHHFNLTVELPLKAIIARPLLRDRPDLVDQPRRRRVQARAQRDGQPLPVHRALRRSSSTTSAAATTAAMAHPGRAAGARGVQTSCTASGTERSADPRGVAGADDVPLRLRPIEAAVGPEHDRLRRVVVALPVCDADRDRHTTDGGCG